MDNFTLARLRLTGWFLVIVMLISGIFSTVIYRDLANELNRSFEAVTISIQSQPFVPGRNIIIEKLAQDLANAKRQVLIRLLIVNGFILVSSGIIGYFLANKNLKPIEEGLKRQKQFIADASHELKTPLTALRAETEVALKQKIITSKQTKEILKSNLEEIIKMQDLTNYLLLLSRHEESEIESKTTKINIKKVVLKAIAKHKTKIKDKNIKIDNQVKEATIFGTEISIIELISILLDNAIKYSPNNKTILIKSKTTRESVVITINDQGFGIPKEEIPYIFNRFYRSDTSRTKHDSTGYGLGLAIAQSIVEKHNGKIEVKSKFGKGSTFSVTLPKGVI